MSAPHVAAVAALILQAHPDYTVEDVKNALYNTAVDLGAAGWDPDYGWGRVNADAAVNYSPDVHDVAVTGIAGPSLVITGGVATINVSVKNEGTYNETFDVVLADDTDSVTIGTKSVSLAPSASTTVSLSWNTTGASLGNHNLSATAGPVAGETDTADNSMSMVVSVEAALTDIAVTAVSAPSAVVQGDAVVVDVTVENVGNQDVADNITVTLNDDTDGVVIGTPQTITGGLAVGVSTTLTYSWDTSGASIGNHSLTASHDFSDDDLSNDSESATLTVTEAGATVHVASIDMSLRTKRAGKKNTFTSAVAIVTIVGASGSPAEGATVYGSWSGATSDTDSGITDSAGRVTLQSNAMKNASGGITFTFTVDDVAKSGYTYDPTQNAETSDSITVP